MKLPNGQRAVVDVAKLRDYCLNQRHPRGRHKARVFGNRLGIAAESADILRNALLEAARSSNEARPSGEDGFGQRYVLDFKLAGPLGEGAIRSHWIVRSAEEFPRLTTCYDL